MKSAWLPILSLLAACAADAPDELVLAGNTMGTRYNVKLLAEGEDAATLQSAIEAELERIEQMMSTYRDTAEISAFNRSLSTDWQAVSAEFCLSVEQALGVSAMTAGAFDITVQPLVDLWGFGPSGPVDSPPADAAVASALASVGYRHLQADCTRPALRKDIAELMLDMSAFGKGLAVDRVATLLGERDIVDFLVEVGGELRLRGLSGGGDPWAVGIELPRFDARRAYTVVHLSDAALATSGDYRNFFEWQGRRFSHTIDTRTGKPVTHNLASVTVIDDLGYRADALATALLVLGPDDGMRLAREQGLAVLFLLRGESDFEERTTPEFDRLRSHG